ncbi:MAG TPA: diguanylate cyclase [Candidatus Aquicultor sp.]
MLREFAENNGETFRRVVIAIPTTLILAYLVLMFSLQTGNRVNDAVLRLPVVLSVLYAFVGSSWAVKHSKAYKRLWRLVSISMLLWFAGEATYASYVFRLGVTNVPSPSLADIFSIAYAPLILGIMVSLGRIHPPFDMEKKQFLIGVFMTGFALLLVAYKFVIAPAWYSDEMSLIQRIFFIATYPLTDCIVLISLLSASYKLRDTKIEGWLVLFISAFVWALVGDIVYYTNGLEKEPFTFLPFIMMAFFIALSAIDEVSGVLLGTIDRSKIKLSGFVPEIGIRIYSTWRTLFIPMMTVVIVLAVWVYNSYVGRPGEVPVLGMISAITLMLLVYRNHLLLSDNAALQAKALRDNTTGLNNHRYFQEALDKTMLKAQKAKRDLSLVMVDIDNFATVNNMYGHIFGDKVLAAIGKAILSKLREADEACRLSGDEFAIILPRTNAEKALKIAEGTKAAIGLRLEEEFPDADISVTVGVSAYPTLAKDKDELLHTADGTLYWGKITGKNQALLYDANVVEALSADERASRAENAALIDMIRSLARAVDARDPYTRQHSKRVSAFAVKLARYIDLDPEVVSRIEIAGMLHDIGKIGVPDQILNKPGRLTDEEMEIIKNHPGLSAQILESTRLKEIIPMVNSHHERWDGKGYPSGLKGENIPFEARILALADTFDAMTSDRPYRKGLTVEEALAEIERCAGSQFDAKLTAKFIEVFSGKQVQSDLATIDEEITEDEFELLSISA